MYGLYYKKDGSLDMTYNSSRQAMSSAGYDLSSPSCSGYSDLSHISPPLSSNRGLHYKKDGFLDMRCSSSKQAAASGVESRYGSASCSSGCDRELHYKKDDTLDMRYRSSKKAAGLAGNFNQITVNTPSPNVHYKKDGSLDMRYRSSKQEVHGTVSGYKPVVQQKSYGIPDHVPKKKDGTQDMRTRAAKDWVAGQASACVTSVGLRKKDVVCDARPSDTHFSIRLQVHHKN